MKDRTAGIPQVRFIKVNKSSTFLSRQKTLHTLRQACCPDLHKNTWQNALFDFMFHSFVTLIIAYRVMYLWWDIHLLQSILNTVSWQLFYVQGYYNFAWTTLIFLMKSKWFCHRIKSHHYFKYPKFISVFYDKCSNNWETFSNKRQKGTFAGSNSFKLIIVIYSFMYYKCRPLLG